MIGDFAGLIRLRADAQRPGLSRQTSLPLGPADLSARGMRHMGRRDPPATCENRAVLPLCGCPLHPAFRGFPEGFALGAAGSHSAAQEARIRRIGRRLDHVKGSSP